MLSQKIRQVEELESDDIALVKQQSRLCVRKYSFTRGSSTYGIDSLPNVHAGCVNMLKNGIVKYLVWDGYT